LNHIGPSAVGIRDVDAHVRSRTTSVGPVGSI